MAMGATDAVEGALGSVCLPELEVAQSGSIFFARAPPVVTEPELLELFEQFGEVVEINLFRRWATAKTSKGCGTVVYAKHSFAVAALEALDGKFQWDASETSMVLEWLDSRHDRATAPGTDKHTAAGAGAKPRATAPSAPKARTPPSAAPAHKDRATKARADAAALKDKQQLKLQAQQSYDGCSGAFCTDAWSNPLDACSWGLLPEQANHVPVHVLPLVSSQMRNTTAAMANNAGSQYSTMPQSQVLLHSMQSASASSSLLPDIPLATSSLATDQEDWGVHSCTWNHSSCNTSFTSIWNNDNKTSTGLRKGCGGAASVPLPLATSALTEWQLLLRDQAWQGSGYNSSIEPSFPTGSSATCYAMFEAPMCGMEDGTSVSYSTDMAFDSLCSNLQAAADVTASFSNRSLPGLVLDAVPSLEWLQLQQQKLQVGEQQAQVSGASAQHQPAPATDGSSSSNLTPPEQQCIALTDAGLTASGCAQEELQLDISPETVYAIGGAVDSIAKLSGAHLQINASKSGLELRISGGGADVEAACQLIGVLLS